MAEDGRPSERGHWPVKSASRERGFTLVDIFGGVVFGVAIASCGAGLSLMLGLAHVWPGTLVSGGLALLQGPFVVRMFRRELAR